MKGNPYYPCLQGLTRILFLLAAGLGVVSTPDITSAGESKSRVYLSAVQKFADTVIAKGRDTYGQEHTPLFVDGLQAETLKPVVWKKDGESWILCNFASQQPLLRTLKGLSSLTDKGHYCLAAADATRYALQHLQSPSGLLYWGGHLAWDLDQNKPVGQYHGIHELKGQQPYYEFMWQLEPEATRKLLEGIWATHVLDWRLLDYNRHANTEKPAQPQWKHVYAEAIDVPFPARGSNLSFVNVTPPLLHSSAMLAVLDDHEQALIWTRRLAQRWQQGKHPVTGLCGGQLSYRKHDRAQDALGHVHPYINEAQIVASYHQTCRYHSLPLVQMQAGLTLKTSRWRGRRPGTAADRLGAGRPAYLCEAVL
jgi:pectate lyase